jgi:hypothetical protein
MLPHPSADALAAAVATAAPQSGRGHAVSAVEDCPQSATTVSTASFHSFELQPGPAAASRARRSASAQVTGQTPPTA